MVPVGELIIEVKKESRGYILFCCAADQNVISLNCGSWSRLIELVKVD